MKFTLPKKKGHRFGTIIAVIVLLIAAKQMIPKEYTKNPDPNHTHTDFAVYIEDTKWDFSGDKYMSGVSYDDESYDEEKEYLHEYLHLHDNVGYVIHSHKPDYTMADFMESIGFRMSAQCLRLDTGVNVCPDGNQNWRMFWRETPLYDTEWEEVEWNPDYVFADMDQILLTYQSDDEASRDRIEDQLEDMSDAACLYSRTCPWEGEAPAENCIADPEVPCVIPLGE